MPLIRDQLVLNDWDIMDDKIASGIDNTIDSKSGNRMNYSCYECIGTPSTQGCFKLLDTMRVYLLFVHY